jgi:hypothetical protein
MLGRHKNIFGSNPAQDKGFLVVLCSVIINMKL